MATKTIYPNGNAIFTVPATQSVAISNFGGGIAQIYYLLINANAPDAYQLQQTLQNSSVTLGAFTTDTVVKIEANGSKVIYDVGSSPDTGIGDADTLNGLTSSSTTAADTIVARDSSGKIAANGATVTDNAPAYELFESDSSTAAKFIISGGGVFIQAGASGSGAVSSSGNLRLSGYVGADLNTLTAKFGGSYHTVYTANENPSLASGSGISGTFTTVDAKTVTVTNGIITSIV